MVGNRFVYNIYFKCHPMTLAETQEAKKGTVNTTTVFE